MSFSNGVLPFCPVVDRLNDADRLPPIDGGRIDVMGQRDA
jgi:hypothetical protein